MKSDAKAAAARENGKKGGRKTHEALLVAALQSVEVYLSSSPYATDSDAELREVRAVLATVVRGHTAK